MQALVPTGNRNPAGAGADEILAALRGASGFRHFTFRYELLDRAGSLVGDLDGVESCSVDQNWLADIKRTARFRLQDLGSIDFMGDRIKPYARLHLPPYSAGRWVEWPQGVFLLSSPVRQDDPSGRVYREVQGYDLLKALADDKVEDRYAAVAGATVVSVVDGLAFPVVPLRITFSGATLPTTREWDPGTPKLRIINDLLDSINYESLSIDEDGYGLVRPYRSPAERSPEYTYADDEHGLIVPGAEQQADIFDIANKWVLTVSEPDRPVLISTYTNSNPGSPTSTVRRGRTIVDHRIEQDATDQAALDGKVARLAFEASQVFETVPFTTALMPIHSGNDVYRIRYSPLSIDGVYTEHSWSMELRSGARMRHSARRVVTV